jgi:hypothetical protein
LSLYAFASSGEKQADLGGALVSAAVIGVLVVYFERSFRRETTEIRRDTTNIQDAVDKSAAPQPAVDVEAPEPQAADREAVVADEAEGVTPTSGPQKYTVQYLGWQFDSSRVDAQQARLRVLRENGTYFQFFTAIMSGIAIRTALGFASGITAAQFRRAVAVMGSEQARAAIRARRAPLDDPTIAIELFPKVDEVIRRSPLEEDREFDEGETFTEIWA